jgi:hypothetical protein
VAHDADRHHPNNGKARFRAEGATPHDNEIAILTKRLRPARFA